MCSILSFPCGSRALSVVEIRPSVWESVKTTETTKSLSQPRQLYSGLPNHAVNQRAKFEMSMLDEIATEAAASAEMQTQPVDLPTAVDSKEAEADKMAGHTVKRMAVATSEDSGPEGRPIQVDDCENTFFEGKSPGGVSDDPMGHIVKGWITD